MPYTRRDQKITIIFKFPELHMFNFRISASIMLVHMSVTSIHVDHISHFVLSVCIWQIKRFVVFWCALWFFTSKKWIKCVKFCVKNSIKCARTFEMLTVAFGESTMSRTQVQLWYNRFKEGWADVKTMFILVARARQQPTKTLNQGRNWFWIIV